MISTTASEVSYTGNASTVTAYSITFPLSDAAHLVAIKTDAEGVETTLTGGQLTFTPTYSSGRINGGSVTTNPAIAGTATILFKRVTPKTQTLDFTAGGSFEAETIESNLDKMVMILQEIARDFGAADTLLSARVTLLE